MTSMRDAINEAYKTAMKARDEVSVRTLRLLNSDIRKLEVDERKTATDPELMQILQRNIKKRREAIEAAQAQGRQDVVDSENGELQVLQKFLPEQLGEAELAAIIDATIKEVGASLKKEQGKVMSALMPKIQGKADGKLVAKLVSDRLK